MFSKEVLNIFSNPVNAGRIKKPDAVEDLFNSNKTAHIEFSMRIENGLIKDCKFRAQAEPDIIAICDTVAGAVLNKPANMILVDAASIAKSLKVNTEDVRFCIDCAVATLQEYKNKLMKANKKD